MARLVLILALLFSGAAAAQTARIAAWNLGGPAAWRQAPAAVSGASTQGERA
jgi:hypothetical protein